MRNNYVKGAWWVVVSENEMLIHNEKGERLYGEIFCRVTDAANDAPTAIFKAVVNIAGSKEEMMKGIENLNTKP